MYVRTSSNFFFWVSNAPSGSHDLTPILFFWIIHLLQQVGKEDLNLSSPHKEDQAMPLIYKALGYPPPILIEGGNAV